MTQSPAFAPAAVPLPNYPEEKYGGKENQQIDGDEKRQANANHGAGASGAEDGGRVTSFPHSTVAIAQMRSCFAAEVSRAPGETAEREIFLRLFVQGGVAGRTFEKAVAQDSTIGHRHAKFSALRRLAR